MESPGVSLLSGPVLDSAANVPVVTVAKAKQCNNKRDLQNPVCVEMAEGVTKVDQMVDIPGAFPVKNALVMKHAKESVVPVHTVCKQQKLVYVQDENGAALVDTKAKIAYECPADKTGTQYKLPQSKDQTKIAASVTLDLRFPPFPKPLAVRR